jgi:hypothetical protein
MALSQKYLERVRRLAQEKDRSKTVSLQQMARLDAVIKQQRIECEKGGWRADAKWLEKNFPQDFGEAKAAPRAEPSYQTRSSINCSNSEPANDTPTVEPPQDAPAALPAPSPIPLASAFWQALLYGSRDTLVSPRDANTALRLVAFELGKDLDVIEFTESLRVNTLRKMLDGWGVEVWHVMNRLWRAAPASPGAPIPNADQSHCSPGARDCPRSMPTWRRGFHQEISNEQRLLESMGGWCG